MSVPRLVVMGMLLTGLSQSTAYADGLIVPFAGVNFGGDSGAELRDGVNASRFDWGVSLAWMGGGVFGVEGDLGYSPDFFGKTDRGDSKVVTLMGNLLLGVPFGGQSGFGVRPYGLVGVGIVRPEGDAFPSDKVFGTNRAAWNFGGGLMLFFATHVGLRGDIRYIRTLEAVDFLKKLETEKAGHLDFTRASLGLVLRF